MPSKRASDVVNVIDGEIEHRDSIRTYLREGDGISLKRANLDILCDLTDDAARADYSSWRVFNLINSFGGRVRFSKRVINFNAALSSAGAETFSFIADEAASAAANIAMSADTRFALKRSQMMFHLPYSSETGQSGHARKLDEWFPQREFNRRLEGMVDEVVMSGQVLSLRRRISQYCEEALEDKCHPQGTFRDGNVNNAKYDSDISFTGSQAEKLGLVKKAYSNVSNMRVRLEGLLGEASQSYVVREFLESR